MTSEREADREHAREKKTEKEQDNVIQFVEYSWSMRAAAYKSQTRSARLLHEVSVCVRVR